jgi:hypothetical protein
MPTDYITYRQHLEERLGQLGRELPGPMGGFARLHRKSLEDGALPGKVKELMALAGGLFVRKKAFEPIPGNQKETESKHKQD